MTARAPDPLQLGLDALHRTASTGKHAAQIQRLVPVLRELAALAGAHGVTVSELRVAALQRGLLPAAGEGRSLSFLGAVPRVAGLVRTGATRRSDLAVTHANVNAVWVLP